MPWYDAHRCSPALLAFLCERLGGPFSPRTYRFWFSRAENILRWRRLPEGGIRPDVFEAEGMLLVPEEHRDECAGLF